MSHLLENEQRDYDWRQEVVSAPKIMVYFPVDVIDSERWFIKTSQYFNYKKLALIDARKLLDSLDVKVNAALSIDGVNGHEWERNLDSIEEGLVHYLGFKRFYTNSGIKCYLETVMLTLLDN
ncbi:MAG: hypothetical protein ACMXYG_04600 [Candidatus Woesearchaeota archaeon]